MFRPACIAFALLGVCALRAAEPPNIVVILADDFGVGLVEAYEDLLLAERSGLPDCANREDCRPDPPRTPTLNALAAQGILFRNCWANPVCSPTRAQLLTGLHAFRNGVGEITNIGPFRGMYFTEPPLPWLLNGAGYRTAVVGKWHLAGGRASQDLQHPTRQEQEQPGRCEAPVSFVGAGFDYFAGSTGNLDKPVLRPTPGTFSEWEKNFDGNVVLNHAVYATTDTVDDALALLDPNQPLACVQTGNCSDYDLGGQGAPWMLLVSLHAPHRPFHFPRDANPSLCPGSSAEGWFCGQPKPVDDGSQPVVYQQVREMVEAMDTELARLLAGIDLATTYVIFLGDNGTVRFAIAPQDRNRPDLLDPCATAKSKASLYENGVRVPMIIAGPGVAQGVVSEALVSAIDVHATLLELAKIPIGQTDAVSLVPILQDPAGSATRRTVYAEKFNPNFDPVCDPFEPRNHTRAVRDQRYKVIRTVVAEEADCPAVNAYELYDLFSDPFEEHNLLRRPRTLRDPRPPVELVDAFCALKCRLIELGVDAYVSGDVCAIGRGDLNLSGVVDTIDLAIVLATYGCVSDCQGDVDQDGRVDLSDLAIVLAHFGTDCPTP